jgi:hypothetical protein
MGPGSNVLSLCGAAVFVGMAGVASAAPGSAGIYLTPAVHPGDRLDTIFSKAVAITGTDFDPLVRRISGSASDRIEAVTPDAITEYERYVYDGRASGSVRVVIRNHGISDCNVHGKCDTNDSTSATMFDSLLWGAVPGDIVARSTWHVEVKAPWEIGPAGEEKVSVERLDPRLGLITLTRSGSGTGRSSDDAARNVFTIVSHGRSINVKLNPGPARWQGRATFVHGVTIADEITLTRSVELVGEDGRVFHGNERIYTIFAEG